ncbi:hypothetical protein ACIQVA_35045 [Streptomyces microflavus]|uniref:hypothetical protein n=1 Tax=Streptomyces microflavus TaxID=1919 RepID=UPI003819950A
MATETSGGGRLTLLSLSVVSDSLPEGKTITLDPAKADKSQPVTIKQGVEYHLEVAFRVDQDIVSGVRYVHVVKQAGLDVDKLQRSFGSYGPSADPYTEQLESEAAPTGIMARGASYLVRSRLRDDDGTVHADFEWSYELATEW